MASYTSRAAGGDPRAALDEYGLLKTMIDQWRDAFDDAFARAQKYRARSFVTLALEARNTVAHAAAEIEDAAALRYLDACHELLRLVKAPDAEIAEARRLYDEQRHAGLPAAPPATTLAPTPQPVVLAAGSARRGAAATGRREGTIEQRLLDYVRRNPGLDDDELARNLGVQPRQSINMAARRLEARGLLRRSIGPSGKIVNKAEEALR